MAGILFVFLSLPAGLSLLRASDSSETDFAIIKKGEVVNLAGPQRVNFSQSDEQKAYDTPLLTAFYMKIVGSVDPHYHKEHDEFFVIQEGKGTLLIRENGKVKKYDVKAGEMVFISKGLEHAYLPKTKTGVTISSVMYSPRFVEGSDRVPVDWGQDFKP